MKPNASVVMLILGSRIMSLQWSALKLITVCNPTADPEVLGMIRIVHQSSH